MDVQIAAMIVLWAACLIGAIALWLANDADPLIAVMVFLFLAVIVLSERYSHGML